MRCGDSGSVGWERICPQIAHLVQREDQRGKLFDGAQAKEQPLSRAEKVDQ
jgi:hypothetical protein